ncbi:hypothetical protein IMY05_C4931000100 [Salix suchowensis]|nr:hypothetical protein IMY05_C4931000100 [Salix suchowensis]
MDNYDKSMLRLVMHFPSIGRCFSDTYGKHLAYRHCVLDVVKSWDGLKKLHLAITKLISKLFDCHWDDLPDFAYPSNMEDWNSTNRSKSAFQILTRRPKDTSFKWDCQAMYSSMQTELHGFDLKETDTIHRCGNFPALALGYLMEMAKGNP